MIRPFVNGPVHVVLTAVTLLFVHYPLALVPCALSADVKSIPVSFTFQPVSLKEIAISMDQPTKSVDRPVAKMALIPRSIRPDLNASSMLGVCPWQVLPFIPNSFPVLNQASLFNFLRDLGELERRVLRRHFHHYR